MAGLLTFAMGGSATATDFFVTNTDDSGLGSLRQAIEDVNAAAPGMYSIIFDDNLGTVSLGSDLPPIMGADKAIIIQGNGNVIDGQSQAAIFFVAAGTVTIEDVTLSHGSAQGGVGGDTTFGGGGGGGLGAGGAVFVNEGAVVTVRDSIITGSSASGGQGGSHDANENFEGGGGGGGFSGDGGTGRYGGGGGGGLQGHGGSSSHIGGGGGGGATQNGGSTSDSTGGVGGGAEGGGGGDNLSFGESGLTYGGGGGGGAFRGGGNGSDFGGGGGGGLDGDGGGGGAGGFGAGGGGAGVFVSASSAGGFGGGGGGRDHSGGDGGDGLGGAFFVRDGGSLTLQNVSVSGSSVTAGQGGTHAFSGSDGQAAGAGMYLHGSTILQTLVTSGTVTWEDEISGTGGVTMLGGGTLELTGTHSYTGDTTVEGGRLTVDGTIASTVVVDAQGTLDGSGTIGGLVLNGTFAPGNSIGTKTINGNATFNSDSTTQIEINDGGTTPGVNNDLIEVTGDVTINGGAVQVIADTDGAYKSGSVYTFLTANSITGQFDLITDNLAFFDAHLIYNLQSVQFELVANMSDFAAVAQSFNQTAIGVYIDDNSQGAPAGLQAIIDEMMPMTTHQVQQSLDQMSGAIFGSLAAANLQHTSYYLSQMAGRLRGRMVPFAPGSTPFAEASPRGPSIEFRDGELVLVGLHQPCCRPQRGGWLGGYGLGGSAQGDGNADGFRYGLGGTQLAVEQQASDIVTLGAWANLAWSNVRGRHLDETANMQHYHFGGYLAAYDGVDYLLALGGLGYDHYDVRRRIAIGGIGALADADFGGWQANTYLERGRSLRRGSWVFQPYGALQYVYLRQGSLRESGAGMLDLDVAGLDVHSLRSIVGLRLTNPAGTWGRRSVAPEFRAAWLHEFLDTNQVINAGFADLGTTTFAVRGVDLGRDWATLGSGLNLRMTRSARLFAGYDVQFNDRQTFHIGSGGAEFVW